MKSLIDYFLNEEYAKVERLGDRLAEIDSLIDREALRPIVAGMYRNKTEKRWKTKHRRGRYDKNARASAMVRSLRSRT